MMSGHHPTHSRLPMGNPPPVEHGIGGWNHISHEAPGVGIFPGALNQPQSSLLGGIRGMVPQTAHLGSSHPSHSSHPAWLNKVPGGSHNGDGSSLPPNPAPGAPPSANQLFMQLLANPDRRVAAAVAAAGYRATNPYQADMIDLSRPAASHERTEPLPLVMGSSSEKESLASCLTRNGNASSDSAAPLNGEVNSDKRSAPAVVSVIATNPTKSVEPKISKADHPVSGREVVRSSEGSGELNNKTDSDKVRAPIPHLKAAPVQTIVGHSKKMKSVEAIVENLFELGSKKQEADSTNTPGTLTGSTSPSQISYKPITGQTVLKTDSSGNDLHCESEDGDGKIRRKRKIETPTRKSMSPPPVKKALLIEQGNQPAVVSNPEKSETLSISTISKLSPTPPSIPNVPSSTSPPESSPAVSESQAVNPNPIPSVNNPPEAEAKAVIKEELPAPPPTAAPSEPDKEATAASTAAPVKAVVPTSSATSQSSVVPSTSECPVSTAESQKEDTKSAVVDVESKMEALFAGIVESGDEAIAGPSANFGEDLTNPLTSFNESLDLDTSSNIAAVLEAKPPSKKGRPKGSRNGIRQSSDSIFGTSSTESTPQKGKKQKKKNSRESIFGESPGKKNKKLTAGGKKTKFQKEPSQQTCDSGSTVSSVRIKGPVVHCVGPRESPHRVSVVNAPSRDDEDQDKSKKPPTGRRKIIQNEGKITSSGLCSSLLVTRSEIEHPQNSNVWVCVFCKTGPHVSGLGDLFGPYLIGCNDSDSDHDGSDKKRAKHGAAYSPPGSQLGMLPVTPSMGDKPHFIVYLHEDCVVWASGVYFVGARLAGLDEAVWQALNTKCDFCRNYGANLGCLRHGCAERSHYRCALEGGWNLNEDLFKSTCSIHPMKEETP